MKFPTLHNSIITIFVSLYVLVSGVSMIHMVDFFKLSNTETMSWVLAIAFEIGAAASLLALSILSKIKEGIVWSVFILLFLMQVMGNIYNSYSNLDVKEILNWIQLFGLDELTEIEQKRVVATISGLPIVLIAIGYIKCLIDYLKPAEIKTEDDSKTILTELDLHVNKLKEDLKVDNIKPIQQDLFVGTYTGEPIIDELNVALINQNILT